MKSALLLALNNIKRYKLSSFGRSVLLLVFSFVTISALMFSISITNAISDILNTRSSGNNVIVSADKSELINISKMPYVNEAVLLPTYSFASGNAEIEDVGTFHINCSIRKASDESSLFPDTYFKEFNYISDDEFILAGRLPQNNNELIIDSRYIDKLQIYDYSQILGKKLSAYNPYFDEIYYDIDSAIIVGVYSASFLKITALDSISDSAYCFMLDNSVPYSGRIMVFCNREDIDKVSQNLKEKYGETNVITNKISTFAVEELINISSFIKKVMILVSVVIGMVYMIMQISMVTNYLNEKQDFVSVITAFGLKKENLLLTFIFEYMILLIIPFALSCVLSVIFTKTLSHYASVLAGISYSTAISPIPIIVSFIILFVISLISILFSVYIIRPKRNE